METELDIVNFEQAKALKELGFNYKCQGYYDLVGTLHPYESAMHWNHNANTEHKSCYSAPSLELVAKWFREEKNLNICPIYNKNINQYFIEVNNIPINIRLKHSVALNFSTYEEALSTGINKAIINKTIEILNESE